MTEFEPSRDVWQEVAVYGPTGLDMEQTRQCVGMVRRVAETAFREGARAEHEQRIALLRLSEES